MSAKTLLFVTNSTVDGREGFRPALEIASGLGARVALLVIGGTNLANEREGLLRAAAYAEAGYYPGLRERLHSETRAVSERVAEFRAWFQQEAAAVGVELEIRNGTANAVVAAGDAVASMGDVSQVLFSPSAARDNSFRNVRSLASRIEREAVAITDPAVAAP